MSVIKTYSKILPLVFVSFLYLISILILGLGNIPEIKEMKPNEWGDFLAGTFAPLAFMWLVFGYKQQGEELKQNTIALRLQADELKNNVEQQKILVAAAKDELALIQNKDKRQIKLETLQAQPYFHIDQITLATHRLNNEIQLHIHLSFKNSRALCRSLYFLYSLDDMEENHILTHQKFSIVDGDINVNYRTNIMIPITNEDLSYFPKKIFLNFNYTDLYDIPQIQSLLLTIDEKIPDHENQPYQWMIKSYTH